MSCLIVSHCGKEHLATRLECSMQKGNLAELCSWRDWLRFKEGQTGKGEKNWRGNPDSRQRQDQLSPSVPRGRVNCLCPGSGDGVMKGEGGGRGQRPYQSYVWEGKGNFKPGLTFSPPPSLSLSLSLDSTYSTHTSRIYTHLLSGSFRNCRLRPDHPQEGKQGLISALQGPALSPGLSPLHTAHLTHSAQSTGFLTHLTSPLPKSWNCSKKMSLISLVCFMD